MTYRPPPSQRDSNPAASQEEILLGLIRQAEGYAYVLAHSYDIGGRPDRAYGLVALGERLRETATDVSILARPVEPHRSCLEPLGLRSRAFSLRILLRGTASQSPSVAPLVPRLGGERSCHEAEMMIRRAHGEGAIHPQATSMDEVMTDIRRAIVDEELAK
jgi:hypothetical protein